jgi:hypothetical protein
VTNGRLPPEVERFIAEHIASVAQLEILMLLRARANDELSADTVGRELRIDPGWAAAELQELAARGFVTPRSGSAEAYRYGPRTPDVAETIDAVVDAYVHRRVTVVNLIFAKPSKTVLVFAEAFRLRKD